MFQQVIVEVVFVCGSQVHGADNDVGHTKPLVYAHILHNRVFLNDINTKHLHAKPLANFDHLIAYVADPDHEKVFALAFLAGEAVPVKACKTL